MRNMDTDRAGSDPASYRLSGGGVIVGYDPRNCRITSLVNPSTGTDIVAIPPIKPLFGLVVLDETEGAPARRTIYPACQGKCISYDGHTLVMRYDSMGEDKLNISCILTIEAGEEVAVRLRVENEQPLPVVEILCPMVDGIVMDDHSHDYILYPHHAGEKTVNPVEEYASERVQGFWRAQSLPADGYFMREINYCGLASMTWMFYGDAANGLYIASHDERFSLTGVIAGTGWPERPVMCFGYREHHRIENGESWDSGSYILRLGNGDWHWGAERYRAWIGPMLSFDNNPDFLQEEYALNQCYNFKKDGEIHHHFTDIPAMFEKGMEYGVSHMFIASWNRKGFDCNYPEYYPDMELGTAMDICRGIDAVNRRGGFATFYINARLFDLESDFFEPVGRKMAIKDETGEILTEQYGPVRFSLNCPSDEQWQKQLIDTAVFSAKAYGLRGIYLDQLGSAEPFACYDRTHSHGNIGEYNQGYVRVLSEIKRQIQANNPDAFLMTENCGDIYGSYTWGNLTWNGADYDEYYNMFKYTFPEYVQVNMINPRRWIEDREERDRWFVRDIVRAVLLGSILWAGLTSWFADDPGREEMIRRVLAFRKAINPMIAQGRYCDDRGLSMHADRVNASVWAHPQGRLLLMGCPGGERIELDIELPPGMGPGWQCSDSEKGMISCTPSGSGYRVCAEDGMLFAVFFGIPE